MPSVSRARVNREAKRIATLAFGAVAIGASLSAAQIMSKDDPRPLWGVATFAFVVAIISMGIAYFSSERNQAIEPQEIELTSANLYVELKPVGISRESPELPNYHVALPDILMKNIGSRPLSIRLRLHGEVNGSQFSREALLKCPAGVHVHFNENDLPHLPIDLHLPVDSGPVHGHVEFVGILLSENGAESEEVRRSVTIDAEEIGTDRRIQIYPTLEIAELEVRLDEMRKQFGF